MQSIRFAPPLADKRRIKRIWIGAMLAAWACTAQAEEGPLTEFTYTVGVNTVPGTALIDATANDLDLWRKHGLKPVTPPPLGGGDRRAWNAQDENHSDVRLYGMGATINYMSKGVDFVMVADLGTRAEWHMWSLASNPIDAKAISGKRFAVTQLSGTDRLYADMFLKALSLKPNDITLVPTGGVPQNFAALKAGQADIWVTTEHAAILIDRESRLCSISKLSDFVGADWDPYVIVAKRSTLASNPPLVRRAVRVIREAMDHIVKAPRQENVVRLMARFNVDAATADKLLATVSLNPSGQIDRTRIERMRTHYIETGLIKPDALPVDGMFDSSIVGQKN